VTADRRLGDELNELERLSRHELQERWRRHHKCSPPRHASARFLSLALAYTLQERASLGLSASARRELAAIAMGDTPRLSSKSSKIKPGTRLLREWHGETHEVVTTDQGFVWKGRTFRSLTALAHAITGVKWNGHRFFGLTNRSKKA
jgi:hypothetical protein